MYKTNADCECCGSTNFSDLELCEVWIKSTGKHVCIEPLCSKCRVLLREDDYDIVECTRNQKLLL